MVCRQRAGAAPRDAVRLRAVARSRPATSSPRSAPRSTSTACSSRRRAARGAGARPHRPARARRRRAGSWSSTSRPARRPVSKDDAQRHAQLGDVPAGGRRRAAAGGRSARRRAAGLRRQDRRGGADRARAGPRWRRTPRASGASWCATPRRRPRGRSSLARVNDGCAHCPVRPTCPAQAAADGSAHRDTDVQPRRTGRRPRAFRAHRRAGRGDRRPAGSAGGDRRRRGGQDRDDGRPGGLAGRQRLRSTRAGARPDVHPQGRRAAAAPGALPAGAGWPARGIVDRRRARTRPTTRRRSAPTTPSPGTLLREHGLLLPVEPDARLLSETELWQLAFAWSASYPDALRHRQDTRPPSPRWCCALAGELGRAPRRHRRSCATPTSSWSGSCTRCPPGPHQRDRGPSQWLLRMLATQTERAALVPLIDALHAPHAGREGDGLRLPDGRRPPGWPSSFPQVGEQLRATLPGRAARRVPGHRPRPAGRAVVRCSAAGADDEPGADRRRRPDPVDLRLARRVGDQPAAVHHRLPASGRHSRADAGAAHQLAQPAARRCIWPTRCRAEARPPVGRRCGRCGRGRAPEPGDRPVRAAADVAAERDWVADQIAAPLRGAARRRREPPDGGGAGAPQRRRRTPIADALTRARRAGRGGRAWPGCSPIPEVARRGRDAAPGRRSRPPGAAAMRVLTGPRWRLGGRGPRRAVAPGRSSSDGPSAPAGPLVGRRDRRRRPPPDADTAGLADALDDPGRAGALLAGGLSRGSPRSRRELPRLRGAPRLIR